MGGKRLRIKDDLRYRKSGAAECSHCNFYVGNFRRHGLGGDFIAEEPRCRVIGLQQGIPYRVRPGFTCDRFDNSIRLFNMLGAARFEEMYGRSRLNEAVSARDKREAFEAKRKC